MLIGGEPGGGKSVALQLIVAHGALSADCKLILIDGKRVELGLWADCADKFVGPSMDDAIGVMHWLQGLIDERTDLLLQMKKRKVTPDLGLAVLPGAHRRSGLLLRHRRHPGQQKEFNACNRDVVARGRAPGIIAVEATQRPSADIIPTSLRDLFGYRWAFRCSTEAILRHHPRPRLGRQRLLSHRDRPPGTRRVLAARRRRHPPPHQGRLPHR